MKSTLKSRETIPLNGIKLEFGSEKRGKRNQEKWKKAKDSCILVNLH
jgi:hypothetical protein